MTIGNKIAELRHITGYSQLDLGVALGYQKSTAARRVAQYENGDCVPKKDTLLKIADVFEVKNTVFGSENPIENVMQQLLWMSAEERMEVCIALEKVEQLEEEVEFGTLPLKELLLWKCNWTKVDKE